MSFSRRDWLKGLGIAGVGGAGVISSGVLDFDNPDLEVFRGDSVDFDVERDSFKFAALPDIQNLTRQEPDESWYLRQAILERMVRYVAENDFEYAVQLGDTGHDGGNREQLEIAGESIDGLHGEIRYDVLDGNHDYLETGVKTSGLEVFNEQFGTERFSEFEWYHETSVDEPLTYQTFSVHDYDFLTISLPYEAFDETIEEAIQVIEDCDRPTMLNTHAYMTEYSVTDKIRSTSSEEGNSGHEIMEKLVRPTEQIFWVNCGHSFNNINPYKEGGEHLNTAQSSEGTPQIELLSNYQHLENGGNGYLREIEFIPDGAKQSNYNDRIHIKTYSPWLEQEMTDKDSKMAIELDFEDIFS